MGLDIFKVCSLNYKLYNPLNAMEIYISICKMTNIFKCNGNVHFYMLRSICMHFILRNETVWQMPIHVSLLGGVHFWILCSNMAPFHVVES